MPQQTTFSEFEYSSKKKVTRRDRFLAELEALTPWSDLIAVIEPHYPKGKAGRPPIRLELMLRMYLAQQCFGLSDEGIEDALYDSQAIRGFVGLDISHERAPDATTLLKFRRLLEKHDLTESLFSAINGHLEARGILMRRGTVVDATIIAAPSSTKNRDKARDPEMHSTKKGNQYYFGMKAHIGVDAESGAVHTVTATAANEADVTQADQLLHGQEEVAFGDAGYIGAEKRTVDTHPETEWQIAEKRGKIKALPEGPEKDDIKATEKAKAQIRAQVEHPFHIVKNLFKHRKVRYRGLAKNTAQLFTLFGLANLMLTKRWVLA